MAFAWMKKIPSPLEALKSFAFDHRSFEAGDQVDWKDLGWTSRQVYKLIHDGFLVDPFKEVSKSQEKRITAQKKKKKKVTA